GGGIKRAVNLAINLAVRLEGDVRGVALHAPEQEGIDMMLEKTVRLAGPGFLEVVNALLEKTYRSAGFHSSAPVRNWEGPVIRSARSPTRISSRPPVTPRSSCMA